MYLAIKKDETLCTQRMTEVVMRYFFTLSHLASSAILKMLYEPTADIAQLTFHETSLFALDITYTSTSVNCISRDCYNTLCS